MKATQFAKGEFYTLPIRNIIEDDDNAYFQVVANGREYLIRMFDFQRKDKEVLQLKELPVMVKDIHDDDIVFVQNFARMIGKNYDPKETYPFIVINQAGIAADGKLIYNVRDMRGVRFKLRTYDGIYLVPKQKIFCKVRIKDDHLFLQYSYEPKRIQTKFLTPEEFLYKCHTDRAMSRQLRRIFSKGDSFAEARALLERHDNEWIIKAMIDVPEFSEWKARTTWRLQTLVQEYIRIALFLLEESPVLLSFPETERENYQEWIAGKIENAEIYSEVLAMVETDSLREEIEAILHKIRNAGFIYRPEHKISLLIAIFSLHPELLEERIDVILDIIAATNWSRRNADFRRAFCLFITYYIDTNRDTVNRLALVNDEVSNRLLSRMIRAICYLLLMSGSEDIDVPLYRSLLYHYLSYVRYNNTIGFHRRGLELSATLLERAFQALMSADAGKMDLAWNMDLSNPEIFAYRMSVHPFGKDMLTSRAFESDTVRFSVNNNNIVIAPTVSDEFDQNIVPENIIPWHEIRIYLPNANKYRIAPNAGVSRWREWWNKVEQALFVRAERTVPVRMRKVIPEVGQEVTIRVLRQESDYRFYCRIEDEGYYGEGYIDVYGKAATVGLLRYIPDFNLWSFYFEDKPLLFKVRVNDVVNNDAENPVFIFDAMTMIDDFVKENISHNDETDARIVYHDRSNHVMFAISENGYGLFIPDSTPGFYYGDGDTISVRLTDISQARRIQAEVTGLPDSEVIVKEAAENLLFSYAEGNTYTENTEKDADDDLTITDDQFDVAHIDQLITILDHKALMEESRISAYGYLSVARILARMAGNETALTYLNQRLRMLAILEDFGKNSRVDNDEFEQLSAGNNDLIETYPLLKEKLRQIQIAGSIGKQENNPFLWSLASEYTSAHLIGKLARLALSYNLSDGMQLPEHREEILNRIKDMLNIKISIPKTYSFGEEGQRTEFKTSIVFPPEQGMKPNLKQQTFNILKVIAGMANAYGGTLYLGVYDTGTAKGLEDDLAFGLFQGNTDKYKLYVRNEIRQTMGGALNSTIVEEFPEAGDKWIYALKIRPSKDPIALHYDGQVYYFLREGTSTYPYDSSDDLQRVMQNRDFAEYNITSDDIINLTEVQTYDQFAGGSEISNTSAKTPRVQMSDSYADSESGIVTGIIRPNVINNWEEGYGVDVCGYLRFNADGTWSRLDDLAWTEGLLNLAVSNAESNGSLILVYEDGEIQRVKMADILKMKTDARHKMLAGKRPVFISPAKDDDALLIIYRHIKKIAVMRMDDVTTFKAGKITEAGQPINDTGFGSIIACEIIPSQHHEALKPLHNLQSNNSFRTDHTYGDAVRGTLSKLGVTLPL